MSGGTRLRVALAGVPYHGHMGALALDGLAAAARRSAAVRDGVAIEVVEPPALGAEEIAAAIAAAEPDVVALACYVWSARPLLAAAARIRAERRGVVVVAGGPELAGIEAELLGREPSVDAVVHGEGEDALRDVLERLADAPHDRRRDALRGIPGVSARGPDGEVEPARPRAPIDDLDALPSAYLDGSYFRRRAGRLGADLAVIGQYRGCPFRCAYCRWGGETRVRWFHEDRTLAELEAVRRAGIPDVFLTDALFTLRRPRALRVLERLAALRFRDVTLHVDADAVDDELAARLRAVPGLVAHLGVQSGNPETLRQARRSAEPTHAKPGLRRLLSAGVPVRAQAIVGLPTDTRAQLRETIEPYLSMPPSVTLQLFLLQVLPGSEYWRRGWEAGIEFDREPPHFARRGAAWQPEDLRRMKLDAWLATTFDPRRSLSFLDGLDRAWSPGATPLLWRLADRLWEAGLYRDVEDGELWRLEEADVATVVAQARALVAASPRAMDASGAAELATCAALDAAVCALAVTTGAGDRWSLQLHLGGLGAAEGLGWRPQHDVVLALRAPVPALAPSAEAVVLCASRTTVHVVPLDQAGLERLRSSSGPRTLVQLLEPGEGAGEEPRHPPRRFAVEDGATAPARLCRGAPIVPDGSARNPLLLRLPAPSGGRGPTSACNNGCVECLARPEPGPGSDFAADVARKHVVVRDREPLLRPDLPAQVAELRRRGAASVRVLTNGRLLAYPAVAARLIRAGAGAFVVKLFSCDAAAHDAHTRVAGSFEQARCGLEAIRRAGGRARIAFPLPVATRGGVDDDHQRRRLALELTGHEPFPLPERRVRLGGDAPSPP